MLHCFSWYGIIVLELFVEQDTDHLIQHMAILFDSWSNVLELLVEQDTDHLIKHMDILEASSTRGPNICFFVLFLFYLKTEADSFRNVGIFFLFRRWTSKSKTPILQTKRTIVRNLQTSFNTFSVLQVMLSLGSFQKYC
jgi:hypothetical protein